MSRGPVNTRLLVLLFGIVLSSCASAISSCRSSAGRAENFSTGVDSHTKESLLSSTVRITLIEPVLDESGRPLFIERDGLWKQQLRFDEGLGSAVLIADRAMIVTHAHWCACKSQPCQVRIAAQDGRVLAIISGLVFRNLTQYRDQGTLIFLAPEGVNATAATASAYELKPASSLYLVHETAANGDLDVIPVKILNIDTSTDPPTLCIKPETGKRMFPGNSGGGIWLNDALVGNLWEVEYRYERCPGSDTPPPYSQQDVIKGRAALLPAEMTPGL